jgi:hypothetical protein
MIKIKVKVKSEATTYTQVECLPDNYNVSKENADLQRLVQKVCDDSHLKEIEDVKVTASFEW